MVGPLRKDGQPDMRYKSNRESGSSNSVVRQSAPITKSSSSSVNNRCDRNPPGPLRKDGQPDMRYAVNKKCVAENNVQIPEKIPIRIMKAIDPSVPLQLKDGQPSMRYEYNNVKEGYQPGPLRKDGQPDMRYAANKNYAAEDNFGDFFGISKRITKSTDPSVSLQIKSGQLRTRYDCNNEEEEYPPGSLRKDGQLDMRYAANKKYVAENNIEISKKTPTRITTATDPFVSLRIKDGQLRTRYGCNNAKEEYPPGPLRKDGQPDMRYAANKKYVAENNIEISKKTPTRITTATDPFVSSQINDSQPRMRYECSNVGNEWNTPDSLRVDGQQDTSYATDDAAYHRRQQPYVAERGANQVAANKKSVENVKEEDMRNVEVKFGLVNAQGLNTKAGELKKKMAKCNFDIVAVTETWNMDDSDLNEACPKGFQALYQSTKGEARGGGVAIFYRDSIGITDFSSQDYKTFECLDVSLNIGADKDIRLINIYRPPENDKLDFLYEFGPLLRASEEGKRKLLITGDFNLDVENPNRKEKLFLTLIALHGLVQHVTESTHENGGILDLIMTQPSDLSKHLLTMGQKQTR
ncbi:hypothetical protein GHT06_018211 [Daphnia sinensis]|uniref:Endonuclease/exonuclease/phosphatase domain-containing protein n=1 Tax=Daphnia sinensis TaxID=1820382 RepID=A0AAD5KM68_9CRUS|nr:hypothetical protein GHT06_018211 [Daphnia sinensis]